MAVTPLWTTSTAPVSPNYSFVFDFERDFDPRSKRNWVEKNYHQAVCYVVVYLIVIFSGRQVMKNRQGFQLRRLLTAWNVCLAVFSIAGTLRTLPEMIHVIREFGFSYSVCNPSFILDTKVSSFWMYLFGLSKVVELGDTLFIVLRKQKLVFLHWYHHITVLLFCWYSYLEYHAPARWFMNMNFIVHSFMYTYYALKAMRVRVPRLVAMMITLSQITQMILGLFVCFWAYQTKARGDYCNTSKDTAVLGLSIYASYLVLFSKLFYETYLRPTTSKNNAAEITKKIH